VEKIDPRARQVGVPKQHLPDAVDPVAGNRFFKVTQPQKCGTTQSPDASISRLISA
jgi:hypothetical protein